MSSITRKIFKSNPVNIASGTDYSEAIRMDGASSGSVVAPNGFGSTSVTVQWNNNGPEDRPTNADTWYDMKDSDNSAVSAYTVLSGSADYIELPVTVFGKTWVRLKLGSNAGSNITLNPVMVG